MCDLRTCSYPFDWLWSPGKTTYTILKILLEKGIDDTVEYMTSGLSCYKYAYNEHYEKTAERTTNYINPNSGLGITHFEIDVEFKMKLKRRFARFLEDMYSTEPIVFIYADAANPCMNYHIDGICYGNDASSDLASIYELLQPIHPNMEILYFCWKSRECEWHGRFTKHIRYIYFDYKADWGKVVYFDLNKELMSYKQRITMNNS